MNLPTYNLKYLHFKIICLVFVDLNFHLLTAKFDQTCCATYLLNIANTVMSNPLILRLSETHSFLKYRLYQDELDNLVNNKCD